MILEFNSGGRGKLLLKTYSLTGLHKMLIERTGLWSSAAGLVLVIELHDVALISFPEFQQTASDCVLKQSLQ